MMDMFRAGKIKEELEQTKAKLAWYETEYERLRTEYLRLQAFLQETERMQAVEIRQFIANLNAQREGMQIALAQLALEHGQRQTALTQELTTLDTTIQQRKQELVETDEQVLLQSFGLYKPHYDLTSSEAYKTRLETVRKKQADLIKANKAATFPSNWMVNNNLDEGRKMVSDYVNLLIRAFNNECDTAISGVKFNNVQTIEKRIQKAYDTLNRLGRQVQVAIEFSYLQLKREELYLCYEYAQKKQDEKEEQRALRERMKEEARVQREIEAERQRAEKERTHFRRALKDLDARLAKASSEAERDLITNERANVVSQLASIDQLEQDLNFREQNTRAGYVYIISNIGAFGEGVYKIGVTRRLEPQERIDELGDASVPFTFDVHALIFSDDAPALETALHRAFEDRRLNMVNRRREFFRVTLDEIQRVVRTNFSKPVEFTMLADAAEYRESVMKQRPHIG